MKGYYNMPEKTAETIEPDGWLHSGDLATVDEDGYYSIVGRIKDMIIRGGENIYPREIEEFLFTHECVQDVQVAGIPDEKYGELVGAFIIKEDGFDDVTEADIRDFCISSWMSSRSLQAEKSRSTSWAIWALSYWTNAVKGENYSSPKPFFFTLSYQYCSDFIKKNETFIYDMIHKCYCTTNYRNNLTTSLKLNLNPDSVRTL